LSFYLEKIFIPKKLSSLYIFKQESSWIVATLCDFWIFATFCIFISGTVFSLAIFSNRKIFGALYTQKISFARSLGFLHSLTVFSFTVTRGTKFLGR